MGALLLSWRYLTHHRGRSLILVACITLVLLLPAAVELLVSTFQTRLVRRAAETPLVLGRQGSRYDLILNALYFKGSVRRPLSMGQVDKVQDSGLALAIPLLTGRTARRFPIVGTTVDYFRFRGLRLGSGTPLLLLGDAVLGSGVARRLGLGPGGALLSDQGSLLDLSAGYPLRMHVVGVLEESGSPDDNVVFVDINSAWVLEGIGHGHGDAELAPVGQRLGENEKEIVLNAALVEYNEITPANLRSFHFHGNPSDFPATAALVLPRDAKSSTLLKARYRVAKDAQLLVPSLVIDELLGFVLRIKRFFDANLVLVAVSTCLFLVLIVLLSLRVRQREMETLFKMGCARLTVFKLMTTELLLVLVAGLLVAVVLAAILVPFLTREVLL